MKKYLANIFLSISAKSKPKSIQKFNGLLTGAKNYLLIMPENQDNFIEAVHVAEWLLSRKVNVAMVINNLTVHLLKDKSQYRLEEYFPTDKSRLGLPKAKLINRLKALRYDALLGLDKENTQFQNLLARKLLADSKVGIKIPGGENVFQVQIDAGTGEAAAFYKIFLNCLQLLY